MRGNTKAKHDALEILKAEGFVRTEVDGPAVRHFSVKHYRDHDTGTTGTTRDQAGTRPVPDTGTTGTTPLKGGAGSTGPMVTVKADRLEAH